MSEFTLKISADKNIIPSIERLYTETFSTGDAAQWIDLMELNSYLNNILNDGFAIMIVNSQNDLIACLLYTSLQIDSLCPLSISDNFNQKKCAYIAEVMVDAEYRGKGFGKILLQYFSESVNSKTYTDAFIRVWDKNDAAVQLYQKMGYKLIDKIIQSKKAIDGVSEFEMTKLYLHKKL